MSKHPDEVKVVHMRHMTAKVRVQIEERLHELQIEGKATLLCMERTDITSMGDVECVEKCLQNGGKNSVLPP